MVALYIAASLPVRLPYCCVRPRLVGPGGRRTLRPCPGRLAIIIPPPLRASVVVEVGIVGHVVAIAVGATP
eukprot:scaffold11622_cov140-Isochrysis_galbana.AAC.2